MRGSANYAASKLQGELIGVEIGVWTGLNAADMLTRWNNLKMLHLVDIYERTGSKAAKKYAQYILNPFKDRITWHIMDSVEASRKFADLSLDYVYIDAGHDYDNVLRDCRAWYPKVKIGGFFGGHDFIHFGARAKENMVYEAVTDFIIGEKGYAELSTMATPDWWVRKCPK